ncbi:hypothetical protein [Pontibacter mangrovi]|uniref:Uncharacterized protein n=1 Tax=Pontibacter mangrovi TaxID=2589816 RepID=A0A501W924_9BACT|nr:hypothetical protein [Pontibacter mangrovi]TPE46109.1 hypothetical protein FJM65_01820 [Pontibacter mangrovi]
MKIFYKVLGLLIIDVVLIWFWVKKMDPDPSVSIGVLLFVPFVFTLNLIIAAILFLIKRREYVNLFLINSIASSIIMFYLFGEGIKRHQRNRLESWEFVKADTTFQIIRWKKENEFSMSYSTDPGSSTGFLDGKCEKENEGFTLSTDSTLYRIKDNYLIGFRKANDRIKLKKIIE